MKTRVLLTVLVLTISLSALAVSQPLPPQGNDTITDRTTTVGTTGAAGDQDYWTNQMGIVSSTDRTTVMNRAQTVLSGYSSGSFVMPTSTLNSAISSNNPNLYLLDVSPSGTSNISGATSMPLTSLAANYNSIPTDRTIVVVSNNDIDSAVAVTLLRIAGYNAWVGQGGVNAVQSTGTTGTTGTAGSDDNGVNVWTTGTAGSNRTDGSSTNNNNN